MRGPVGKQLFIPSCSVSAHSMARRGHADLGNAANMWIDKETVEGCMYNAQCGLQIETVRHISHRQGAVSFH